MTTSQVSEAKPRYPVTLLPESGLEWLLEAVSLTALGFAIVSLLEAWPDLPARVPRHFDLTGAPDAWGAKINLWVLPFVGGVVYSMLTVVSRIPHTHSFPITLTSQNAPRLYRLSRMLVVWMKAETACTLSYISWSQVRVALGRSQGLGWAFLPVTLVAIVLTILIYRRKSFSESR